MCGIVGLYLKDPDLQPRLGTLFGPMLTEMTDRGPDSAGFAVYRDAAGTGAKVTVYDPDDGFDGAPIAGAMASDIGAPVSVEKASTHTIFHSPCDPSVMRGWLEKNRPELTVMSSGTRLEIYKEIGLPVDVLARFDAPQMTGSHMIGHTRMATESAVTTQGAHPFNTGDDLCLVHNGSLSNHYALKRDLVRDHDMVFQTENDSEVAAGYLTARMSEGASLKEALEAGLRDFDGFYTFTIGTRDGFAVLRDPIACKPAVMAETDGWVAMASEFRALARLPDVENATVWEPAPATVYAWGNA